jgi:hypothetical protein
VKAAGNFPEIRGKIPEDAVSLKTRKPATGAGFGGFSASYETAAGRLKRQNVY